MSTQRGLGSAIPAVSALIVVCSLATAACGKKGPPLPPLLRLPAAPADLAAERRGSRVDLQFTVPNANTDGSRPANVERVDVYAITGPPALTDKELFEHGTRVASVDVKAPRNPDAAVEAGEPVEDVDPPGGPGLDQGVLARVSEELTPAALVPVDLPAGKKNRAVSPATSAVAMDWPLLGPTSAGTRTYVGVGITTRGRKGPVSRRIAVPLAPPPPPPAAPTVTYDEAAITVTWPPVGQQTGAPAAATAPSAGDLLPSTPIGPPPPPIAYHVYDASAPVPVRLTTTAIAETHYRDSRVEWGVERCYIVRAVETIGGTTIESDAPAPVCRQLVDMFPPAPPKALAAVGTEGVINLIWDPSPETDLAGYIVLRGVAPAEKLAPVTTSPVQEPTWNDKVQGGVRYVYAVQAVDKAGNVSAPSNRVEETAR